jgi:hypothetical protein
MEGNEAEPGRACEERANPDLARSEPHDIARVADATGDGAVSLGEFAVLDRSEPVMARFPTSAERSSWWQPRSEQSAPCDWEFLLSVAFPPGYRLHPATLRAVEEAVIDRVPVMGATESDVRIWCTPTGDTFAAAHLDAQRVEATVLDVLGLSAEHVHDRSLAPFESIDEAVARDDERRRPLATVTDIGSRTSKGR